VRLDAPELPDQAAFDKDLVHWGSPLLPSSALRFPSIERIRLARMLSIRFSGSLQCKI
jgi:hypothetical protein